jgi:hypothetical protein
VSRSVVFYEAHFPLQNSKLLPNVSDISKPLSSNHVLDDHVSHTHNSIPLPVMLEPDPTISSPTSSSHTPLSSSSHDSPNLTPPYHDNLRRSTRTITRPSYLEDYHCYSIIGSANNNLSHPNYPL